MCEVGGGSNRREPNSACRYIKYVESNQNPGRGSYSNYTNAFLTDATVSIFQVKIASNDWNVCPKDLFQEKALFCPGIRDSRSPKRIYSENFRFLNKGNSFGAHTCGLRTRKYFVTEKLRRGISYVEKLS